MDREDRAFFPLFVESEFLQVKQNNSDTFYHFQGGPSLSSSRDLFLSAINKGTEFKETFSIKKRKETTEDREVQQKRK